jgi:C4-dicarboxylate-specific signal transduction histidine kinase
VPDEKEALAGDRLIRLDRRLRTFRRCCDMLCQIENEQEALQSLCDLLVEGDQFCLAWVGYCEDDVEKTIRPVAKAGRSLGFPESVHHSWGGEENQRCPPGLAVRTCEPCLVDDISTDSTFPDWRIAATQAGFISCLSLPLIAHDKRGSIVDLRGTLNLCSDGRAFFDEETAKHYASLASSLTHTVAGQRRDFAEGLTSGVKSLRAGTERRRAEEALQAAQVELAGASRLTRVAKIAASIAHEINQPLAAIVANGSAASRWLASNPPDLEEVQAALNGVIMEGHRASQVIASVRAMFKEAPEKRMMLDVNDIIREVITFTRPEIQRRRVTVQAELVEMLPQICVDRIQLQQVIRNLIMNALEAMDAVTDRPRVLTIKSTIHAPRGICVTVSDSGTGIAPKDLQRLFDSFFTTKRHGMGMGLAICQSIVESYGGNLTASSGQPHGAVFQIILPAGASLPGDGEIGSLEARDARPSSH